MNNPIIYENLGVCLPIPFFATNGITESTISKWIQRQRITPVYPEGDCIFIAYHDLPEPSKQKLPSEEELIALAKKHGQDSVVENFFNLLHYARTKGFVKHFDLYKKKHKALSGKQLLQAAQLHAVWQRIVDLKEKEGCRDLERLFMAFDRLYPGKYSSKHAFSNTIKKAIRKSIESVAMDMRIYTAPQNVQRIDVVNQYWAASLVSIGKKYSNRQVWEKLCVMCKESNQNSPSLSWVDKYRKKALKNQLTFDSRNGQQAAKGKRRPYASLDHGNHPHELWQMDGWKMPFWANKFDRYTMVIIRDTYSKKILSMAVGETENTALILEALYSAIMEFECLPYEIIMDKHAFTKTSEAEHLQADMKKRGAQWTVTSNPQYKSIVERYNQHLDRQCREFYGYLGEGIKSKNVDAHPKQELLDDASKNFLSKDEIALIAKLIVEQSNSSVAPSAKMSPNDKFANAGEFSVIGVDLMERIQLLTPQVELTVNRGQINLIRSGEKYEYQLPGKWIDKYEGELVTVHYENGCFDCVYLYDHKTGEPIGQVKRKQKIKIAKINQGPEDIERLNKITGKNKGIETRAIKSNQELLAKALEKNPEAVELLNKMTTQKNVVEEARKNAAVKQWAAEKGIDLDKVHIPANRPSQMDNQSLQPVSKKNNSPFTPKAHKIGIVKPEESFTDD